MATKKEMKAEIQRIGEKLGRDVNVEFIDKMNHAKLEGLLSEYKEAEVASDAAESVDEELKDLDPTSEPKTDESDPQEAESPDGDESSDGDDETDADQDADEPTQVAGNVVAPGHSVTSKRGLIKEGMPIEANDLEAGEEGIERLLAIGAIT